MDDRHRRLTKILYFPLTATDFRYTDPGVTCLKWENSFL